MSIVTSLPSLFVNVNVPSPLSVRSALSTVTAGPLSGVYVYVPSVFSTKLVIVSSISTGTPSSFVYVAILLPAITSVIVVVVSRALVSILSNSKFSFKYVMY